MDPEAYSLIITALLVIAGWYIVHRLSDRRSLDEAKRKLVIDHRISAFRVLANEISHRRPTPERARMIEDLLSEIQLFGSTDEVQLVKDFADLLVKKNEVDLNGLLNRLRDNLRDQLGLVPIEGNVKWVRFSPDGGVDRDV